jgi:hypothetical protein
MIGIGVFGFWGMFASRAQVEWSKNGVALLSIGISGFVILSYAIVAISSIWPLALPILAKGLLILSLLAFAIAFLLFVKKKVSPAGSAASWSWLLLLRSSPWSGSLSSSN